MVSDALITTAPLQDGYTRLVDEVRERCADPGISEDEVWAYIYGVMHAPDWRERFTKELETSPPRFPLPPDAETFAVFARAGEDLMSLHADYDLAPESRVPRLEVAYEEDRQEDGTWEELRIPPEGMRWERIKGEDGKWTDDLTRLNINDRASLTRIPPQAHAYRVAGLSPLQWAVTQEVFGETEDENPNFDPRWREHPYGLIAHLRRLTYVGVRTAEIMANLPPSLGAYEGDGI